MARRALICGAGPSGLLHALAVRAHGVDIAVVFDPDRERATSLADMMGARAVASFEDAAREDVDVIALCGPPPTHVAQAEAVARVGRVTFVEKPLALDGHELDRLCALPGCVPVLQWRFGRALSAVRDAIARGLLGDAPTVNVDLTWRRDESYFAAGRRSRAQWGCGALLSIGIHAVDAVLHALDADVVRVHGALGARPGLDTDSDAVMIMETTRGLVSLRLTLDADQDRTRLSFAGRGVTAVITGTEEDPTASDVDWSATSAPARNTLVAVEDAALGFTHGPLLVPLVGAALGASVRRAPPAPSMASAAAAHRAIYALTRARE